MNKVIGTMIGIGLLPIEAPDPIASNEFQTVGFAYHQEGEEFHLGG